METDTIEFLASENGGDWNFHCHILYHMMAGMGRLFSYVNTDTGLHHRTIGKTSARFTTMIKDFILQHTLGSKAMAAMVRWLSQIHGGRCKPNGGWEEIE